MALSSGTAQVRVRYPEVDRMGVAHHANHLIWFEIGRTELMRSRGAAYARLEDEGLLLPVIEASCAYRAAARYDDLLKVTTEVVEVGRVRIAFSYRIERQADGLLLATGRTVHAAVDRGGRPRRIPAALRELLA
jgi:acyl-CoA thioester hydrolase